MAELVNILLQRCDCTIPWGFKAQGENGCGYTIYVDKVTPGTIASNYLKPGDIILSLSKKHARDLANKDLDEVIKEAGNCLELIIKKKPTTNSSPTPYPGPITPPTPSFSNSNSFAPQPPPRNLAYMSPRSPGNSSPYAPSSPVPYVSPSTPPNFPPPPPMPGSNGQALATDVPQPPPPPPMPTNQSGGASWRAKQQATQHHEEHQQQQQQHLNPSPINKPNVRVNQGPVNQYDNLPAALQSTLSKDKKPFTYTPGGIDLSELRSPKMQRRLYYNQMDPPRNLAKVTTPETETRSVSTPPPPETYPQPRVQLLPTIQGKMPPPPKHMSNRNQVQKDVVRESSPKIQQPTTQAYVHSNYNSPMNLYSAENAAEAFHGQTGEVLPGFENLQMNKQPTDSPRYDAEDNFTPYYKGQFPQSRSFRLLQVMTDTTSPHAEEDQEKMMPNREEDEMKFSGFKRNPIPSRAFQTLQKITGDDEDISSTPVQYQPVNPANASGTENCELRYRGAYIPSRSFKLLQEMTGGSDEKVNATRNRTPKKATMNIQVGNGSHVYNNNSHDYNQQQPQHYDRQGVSQQSQWIPPSEQPAEAEPKKYMGGHIPSRSFRMLQAMTGGDDSATDSIEIPVQHEENYPQQESEPRMYMGSNIPSRSFRMLQQMTDDSQ